MRIYLVQTKGIHILQVMIKKIKGKYVVVSETTGRSFGSYKTLKQAKKRLQQMEFFKHLSKNSSMRGKLRKKSLIKKP